MPIYDFECTKCNTVRELLVKYSSEPICQDCGSELVRLPATTQAIYISKFNVFRAKARKGQLRNVFKKIRDDD